MSQSLMVSTNLADPTIRSSVYKLLSLGFRYPTPEFFEAVKNGTFLTELWGHLSSFSHLNGLLDKREEVDRKIQGDMAGLTFGYFEEKFVRIFEVGDLEPSCPPYEGLHRKDEDRTSIMLEVSEFFKQFGLSMSREEGKRDLPDHVSAEMEFLHFLTFKEAQAGAEETPELLQGYVLAQKDFLDRHMTKWIPGFADKIRNSGQIPFYGELAWIASAFVTAEHEMVQAMLPPGESPPA